MLFKVIFGNELETIVSKAGRLKGKSLFAYVISNNVSFLYWKIVSSTAMM